MNVKIPMHLLGDLKNYKFVSLILDKNFQTIFRHDFVKNEESSFDFFNKKIDYVTVPDEEFQECDSIIFFPFSEKTNNWSSKIMMRKNEEFFKMNGGFEFIKNANSTPDINKIKNWINNGKNIKKINDLTGSKNLIYFTVFGSDEYIELLKILLNSIEKQSFKDFELLFITDNVTLHKIKKILNVNSFKVNYFIVESIEDPVQASMQKLKIYQWEKIDRYKSILFLDVDIVVIGDLKNIFSDKINNNIFYSAIHDPRQLLHKTVYHCLIDYTPDELKNFETKGILAFNAGQFIFNNTRTMKEHFANINSFVESWNGRYFFEQSFLNYYFNILEISDTKTLKSHFQFVSINENQTNNKFENDAVTVHFMGNACNGVGKLDFMKKFYKNYL